jgi:YggT family protein
MTLQLIRIVNLFFNALYVLLFARILLSWFPAARGSLVILIYKITEPLLAPVRKIIQRSPLGGPGMVLDFSPIFVFLLIFFLRDFIISMLVRML